MPKLLFATPNQSYYSETFVRDHIQLLKPDLVLYGGWRPYYSENHESIFKGIWNINLIRAALKRLMPHQYQRLYTYYAVKLIQKEKFECILTEYGITATSLLASAEICGIPITCIFHGFDAYEFEYINRYRREYQKLFQYAPKIICVSEDMKEQLGYLGCDLKKIEVIPCGVDPELFKPAAKINKSGNKLLFIGRFTAKKNPIGLLKSYHILSEKYPNLQLIMAGEGELWEEAKTYAEVNGLNRVTFPGRINREQALYYLNEADVYVQHSIRVALTGDSEGTPVSILEAQAMKLPVVSTFHAGIKDAVINGKTGFLVLENDCEAFATKVAELLENQDLRFSFGHNAREHVLKNYNQKSLVSKIDNVIKSCL